MSTSWCEFKFSVSESNCEEFNENDDGTYSEVVQGSILMDAVVFSGDRLRDGVGESDFAIFGSGGRCRSMPVRSTGVPDFFFDDLPIVC